MRKKIDKAISVMTDLSGYTTSEQILRKCRKQELVTARYLLCMYFYDTLKLSYHRIAEIIKLDHSTVVVGVQRMRERLQSNNTQYDYEKCLWSNFIQIINE